MEALTKDHWFLKYWHLLPTEPSRIFIGSPQNGQLSIFALEWGVGQKPHTQKCRAATLEYDANKAWWQTRKQQ